MKYAKKIMLVAMVSIFCWYSNTMVLAAVETTQTDPEVLWEMNVIPKPTPEEIEEYKWVEIMENDFGTYKFSQEDVDLISDGVYQIVARLTIQNKKLQKSLQEKYQSQLEKKDYIINMDIVMVINIAEQKYKIINSIFHSKKGKIFPEAGKQMDFTAPPADSFVEEIMTIITNHQGYFTKKALEREKEKN